MSGHNLFGRRSPKIIFAIVLAMVAMLAISACSRPDTGKAVEKEIASTATKEAMLTERVRAYWEARRDSDLITAYNMEAQSLPGGTLTPKDFFTAQKGTASLVRYEILSTEIKGDKAVVKIKLTHRLELMGGSHPMVNEFDTHWSWISGQWYNGSPPSGT